MKRIVCATAVLAMAFTSMPASAQPMRGSGGWGAGGAYQRMYNRCGRCLLMENKPIERPSNTLNEAGIPSSVR